MRHASLLIQTAATTGNGTAYDCRGEAANLGFYIVPAGSISNGTVQLETADTTTYSGTWYPLVPLVTLAAGVCTYITYEGVMNAVRARIVSDVSGGGTVSVRLLRSS